MDIETLRANASEDMMRLNPELQPITNAPKPRKYRNEPTEYNGRRYDSVKEATHAYTLDLRVKGGGIAAWCAQVPFPLAGGIRYIADFVVLAFDGTWCAEDAKGFRTKEYKLKRKLFKERYGRDIVEV